MGYPAKGYGIYGPLPWQQTSWDARAAGNFIGGGAGAGLIAFAAFSGAEGAARAGLLFAGLALVAAGLFCVFLELGRPLRAINVLFNPRTSWMSREAIAAGLMFPVVVAAALGISALAPLAALLALVFVFCQAKMVQAARGIPAWREPLLVPLFVATALVEGAGVFLATGALHERATEPLTAAFGVLVIVRMLLWLAYRRRVETSLAADAAAALDRAGRMLRIVGTLVPLVLIVTVATGLVTTREQILVAVSLAGIAAFVSGAYFKLLLITRAGFNQGFALPHPPVRGARS
jgi:phenylacetyl-CoA:acceptor oxidoreductase subunit 2